MPVVPAFEIIASVATDQPGDAGTFTRRTGPDELRPWVDAVTAAGGYAGLDLQPGRETLLDQVRFYQDLLENPHVGLALDPEWKLGPDDRPMDDIGHVDAAEINEVIDWLDTLVAENNLPQKLLMLHQFQTAMIVDRESMPPPAPTVSPSPCLRRPRPRLGQDETPGTQSVPDSTPVSPWGGRTSSTRTPRCSPRSRPWPSIQHP